MDVNRQKEWFGMIQTGRSVARNLLLTLLTGVLEVVPYEHSPSSFKDGGSLHCFLPIDFH